MAEFDPIDGWFERGFRIRQGKGAKAARSASRDARRAKSGAVPASGGVKFSSGAKTKNAASVIRKAPEVMVKVTGSSSGLASVRHHVDYISRNGDVEMFNESGESLQGRDDLKALREQMKASQVPQESNKREFLHVLFSMPPGTPKDAMREAVQQFCREEFANRRYVAALHDDTDHTHVHVCVSTRDMDRADEPRLSPRKADLYRWRQGFADKLREQGIDAAASERRHRFNARRPEHPVVRQIRAQNPESSAFKAERATRKSDERALRAAMRPDDAFVGPLRPARAPKVQDALRATIKSALASGERPSNPAQSKIDATRAATFAAWREVGSRLIQSGQTELAKDLAKFLKEAESTPVVSHAQELFDAAREREAQHARESGTDRDSFNSAEL